VSEQPTTDKVFSIVCSDLETQEHIIRYQLPVLVQKFDVGLVVIDSVAANFRAEFERPMDKNKKLRLSDPSTPSSSPSSSSSTAAPGAGARRGSQMAQRGKEMVRLAATLRHLAITHNLAVVVSNQVSDKFNARTPLSSLSSPRDGDGHDDDIMSLDFQSKWFTGCDEELEGGSKVPALGFVWANLLATRVVIRKSEDPETGEWRRDLRVAYSNRALAGEEVGIEVFEGGVRSVEDDGGDECS